MSSLSRSLALDLADDFLGLRGGDFLVLAEMHGETAAPLRPRPQFGGVPEHGRQRHHRFDDAGGATQLGGFDAAAAGIQVADHIAHVIFRDHHFHGHDGFQQYRFGAPGRFLDRHGAGDFEGHFRGIDIVVTAVVQRYLDIRHRIAGENSALQRFLDADLGGVDVFLRYPAARDVILEHEPAAGRQRLDADFDVAVLAVTAGLLDVAAFGFGMLANGLAILHLRLADVGADTKLPHHAVHDDFQVKLAHPGKDGLAGFGIRIHPEGRIFLRQLLNRQAHLFLVGLGLGLDRQLNHRHREIDGFEHDRVIVVTDRIAGRHRPQTDGGADVARHDLLNLFALVGMHAQQAPHTLFAALGHIEHEFAGLQRARVNPEECQLADVRVGHNLEHQRREGLSLGSVAQQDLFGVVDVVAFDGRNVQRRGKVIHHRVQHGLDTFVLECRAADYREDLQSDGRLADARADFIVGDGFAVDEFVHQRFVVLADRLDHVLAVFLGLFLQVLRNLHHVVLRAQGLVAPHNAAHLHQVHDAQEFLFRADRNLNRHRTALQAVDNGLYRVVKIGAHAVHLIDEANARNRILVRLPPNRFRLRLHAGHGVEYRHRAVQHAQAALHLGGEIDVPGRIDNVDLDVAPLAGGRGRCDRDAAFLFLLHPVHDGGALMNFAQLVGLARVVQDPLGRGGVTGIDMRRDADISHPLERGGSSHAVPISSCSPCRLPPVVREGLVGLGHA